MKCFWKKILLFILCGVLTFSVTSTAYYKSVHAMEWVGGALAFEEALKWLLAAIGITATAGMTDAYWDAYGDDFVDYAIQDGATQTEVAEWQLKACQGIIDKSSVVWSKFKDWAFGLTSNSGGSGGGVSSFSSLQDGVNFATTYFGLPSYTVSSSYDNLSCYAFCLYTTDNGTNYHFYFMVNNSNYSCSRLNNGSNFRVIDSEGGFNFQNFNLNYSSNRYSASNSVNSIIISTTYPTYFYNFAQFDFSYFSVAPSFIGSNVGDTNFDSVTTNVNDLDVISSDGVDEDNPEVTVPMPGVSDSDNEASKDAYQDIIDAINDGTITQEQGVVQIQEILKIITYDTVTDKVVPPQVDPDTGEDKTKDDVLKENKENMGFTLGGLEAVFPFCIPFDIYAFMTLLVADPVAPEFDFPIQSVNGVVEEIHVDLSPFEPVAVVVRYVFDFLFIIGLAMLTRSLIGGGSSD